MDTKYVRDNSTLVLPCRSYHVFGSGCASVSLTLAGGARGPSRDGGNNGFVGVRECAVTLPHGASATVEQWYHPGGESVRTYVADTARWREQRREHLTRLFEKRAVEVRYEAHRRAREAAIRERLAAALRGGNARLAYAIATNWAVEVVGRCNMLRLDRPADAGLGTTTPRWELDERKLQDCLRDPATPLNVRTALLFAICKQST